MNIVNDMIKLGANAYDAIAENAAEGGHRNIVNDMIKLGAKNV